LRPWVRRLLTRSLAILPALIVIGLAGHESIWPSEDGKSTVDANLFQLLVLSQVVLSFQLPFAIVPLVQSTSDPRRMGVFSNRGWLKIMAWACAIIVVALNGVFIVLQMGDWGEAIEAQGGQAWWIYATVGPVALALAGFLGWIAWYPLRLHPRDLSLPTPQLVGVRYHTIGVAVELEGADDAVLAQGAALAKAHEAKLVLIHVVEGAVADIYGAQTADRESQSDRERIAILVDHLKVDGVEVEGLLGYGTPVEELIRVVKEKKLDLLVLGTHGHRLIADLALGSTVAPLLHRLSIPVLVVPAAVGSLSSPKEPIATSSIEKI
jgi:manganese transport protein